jgi:hypothetical protein
MSEVRVIVSGLTGSGKTAVYMEIVAALKAIGLPVSHADPAEFQSLLNGGEGDSEVGIDLYKPTVVMEERNLPRAASQGRSAPNV